MRLLSLKDVERSNAYASLTPAERAAVASRWSLVQVDGYLSAAMLRKWLAGQGVQVATTAWSGSGYAAASLAGSVPPTVGLALPSATNQGAWRDLRAGSMGERARELAGRSALQEVLADHESPLERGRRIGGTGERPKASDYSVGGRRSEPNPSLMNLVPAERRGVTEATADELAQQGIGFKLGDRLAERDAARASWAEELDSEVGLGSLGVSWARQGGLEDGTTDVLVGVVVGGLLGATIVLGLEPEIVAISMGNAATQVLIGTAVIAVTAAALVVIVKAVGELVRDQQAARDGTAGPSNPFRKLLPDSGRPDFRLSREQSEELRKHYFGHLDGTPWMVRSPSLLPTSRSLADPRLVRTRPDDLDLAGGGKWRPTVGDSLGNPADSLRAKARTSPAVSFERVDPRTVRPHDASESSSEPSSPRAKPRSPVT